MQSSDILAYISEREIDLLLLEELHVSADFREWFVSMVFGSRVRCSEFLEAWHSISEPSLGESDVVFTFRDGTGCKKAILVEDKIDAPPQPRQAYRYGLRGERGVKEGKWDEFRTCLIAPKSYLAQWTEEAAKYNVRLSYELIRDWFSQRDSDHARMAYKARVVQEGIEQNRRGYQRIVDPIVTRFWVQYWQIAKQEFSELQMGHPGTKAARSDWGQFKTRSKLWIRHKLGKGTVELAVPPSCGTLEQIVLWNSHLARDGIEILSVGKATTFTIVTREVNKLADAVVQSDAIREGLRAVSRLMKLTSEIKLTDSK